MTNNQFTYTRGSINDITYVEQRMRISYLVGDSDRFFDGWVCLGMDGRTIVARKVRGRNRWTLTTIDQVWSVRLPETGSEG